MLNPTFEDLNLGSHPKVFAQADFNIYHPVSCNEYHDGYRGRDSIYEAMEIAPEISKLIMLDRNTFFVRGHWN